MAVKSTSFTLHYYYYYYWVLVSARLVVVWLAVLKQMCGITPVFLILYKILTTDPGIAQPITRLVRWCITIIYHYVLYLFLLFLYSHNRDLLKFVIGTIITLIINQIVHVYIIYIVITYINSIVLPILLFLGTFELFTNFCITIVFFDKLINWLITCFIQFLLFTMNILFIVIIY